MINRKTRIFCNLTLALSVLLAGCNSANLSGEEPTEELVATGTIEGITVGEPTTTVPVGINATEELKEGDGTFSSATETIARSISGSITLWHSLEGGEWKGLESAIATFQIQNPLVVFNILFVPSYDLLGEYETAIANGRGPTLLIGAADWGPALFDADLIADITTFAEPPFLESINQAALGSVRYQNALIGLPVGLKGVVLYRNKSIITQAPTSVMNLITAARSAARGNIVGANLERGFFFSAGHLYGAGGQLMDENGNALFDNEKGVEWLNLLRSFSDAGPTEYNTNEDLELFMQGAAGMIIDATWNMAEIALAIGEDNLSIDPWPSGMSGFVQSDNIYMGVNAVGDDQSATWAFMKYLLTPDIQATLADNDIEFIPAARGIVVPDRLRQEAASALEGGVTYPVIPEMGAYWGPMDTALKSVFYENADPATALQEAFDSVATQIAEIRRRANPN